MKLLLIFLIVSTASAQITFSQSPSDFSTKGLEKLKAPELKTFAQAAKWADIVAIAQVDDIEYKKVRKLNADGYAFLNVRVPYKGSTKGETIAVIAKGFDDNICYYPDRVNEGERFLVFLKKAPDEKSNVYYGFKPYCQMQILLNEFGQYMLRAPVDNNVFTIDEKLIEDTKFIDPHATLDSTLWTSIKREEYAKQYQCEIIETKAATSRKYFLRYTKSIPVYKIRKLLAIEYKAKITSKQL